MRERIGKDGGKGKECDGFRDYFDLVVLGVNKSATLREKGRSEGEGYVFVIALSSGVTTYKHLRRKICKSRV